MARCELWQREASLIVPRGTSLSRRRPFTLAAAFAKRLQEPRVTGYTVVVDVLAIRHTVNVGIAANAKRAGRALFHIGDVYLLPFQLRLTETGFKKAFRNIPVLLAHLYIQMIALRVHNTSLGLGLRRIAEQEEDESEPRRSA